MGGGLRNVVGPACGRKPRRSGALRTGRPPLPSASGCTRSTLWLAFTRNDVNFVTVPIGEALKLLWDAGTGNTSDARRGRCSPG